MQFRVLLRHLPTGQKFTPFGQPPFRSHQSDRHRFVQTASAASTASAVASASVGLVASGTSGFASSRWYAAAAAAATLVGGAATYLQQPARLEGLRISVSPEEELRSKQYPAWVYELSGSPAETPMLTSNTLLSEEHPMLKRDHMFTALLRHEMVEDMSVFYNVEQRRVSSVIKLGSEICGYPRIVHGGLTAAVVDECLGFLMFALKHQRALPFWGPAYTVHLEIDYKNKIQAGRLLLCEVEVESMEGRKLWMKATVRDGPQGKVYATARALFVAPKTQRLIRDGVKLALHKLFPSSASVE